MILTQRKVDNADKVQLVTSMMAANVNPDRLPEGEIMRVPVPEFGEFGYLAEVALELVAAMHRQSEEDFDGVVWFERFENSGRGSLADLLVEFCIDYDAAPDEVRPVIIAWLYSNNL